MLNKTCMLGLVTIATAVGLISAPARAQNAASVEQSSEQNTTQVGSYNTSVQASDQTGIVSQKQYPYSNGVNAAELGQVNSQGALQAGHGNTSVQGSTQTGRLKQGNPYPYYPYSGGINAANLKQSSGQGLGQLGTGNSAIQAGEQSTAVDQH